MAVKSISTKYGDSGETGLLYGGRVSKADLRVDAYGANDEAVSALGLARALSRDEWVKEHLMQVQRDLFTVGAELATDREKYDLLEKNFSVVVPEMTERITALVERVEAEVQLPRSFIIPGASPASGAMDLARTIIRRTERSVVAMNEKGMLENPEIIRYLNRLSDFVFMLARYEDRDLPVEALTGDKDQ